MPDDSDKKNRLKYNELVSSIYASALNPSDYDVLFKAWDEHFEVVTDQDKKRQSEDFSWTGEFFSHFEQADQLLEMLLSTEHRPISERIHDMPFAAFLSDLNGSNLRWNSHAGGIIPFYDDCTIFDLVVDRGSEKAIQKLCRSTKNETDDPSETHSIVRLFCQDSETEHVFLAEIMNESSAGNKPGGKLLLLRAVAVSWDQKVSSALAATFLLTPAEIDLVECLYQGFTIKEIADRNKRSQATLRTQLSSVLLKTSTKNQADLSRIISGIVQALYKNGRKMVSRVPQKIIAKPLQQRHQTIQLSAGMNIEVVESGDLDGIPFYFIQSENRPTLTPEIVECLAAKNVRLISPYRPGLGQTTQTAVSISPSDWAHYHLEVLEKMGLSVSTIGGHTSGGIYAMELAKLAGGNCKHLLLVDTGAPLETAAMINQMPASPKRMFLAARYFPIALRTTYKLVTADFNRGIEGEKRLVSHFYKGSPADEAIVNTGDNWQITRDNIDYCLQNVQQNISDIIHWSRNTMPALKEVLCNSKVHYFHGEDNFVHQADNIRRLSRKFPNVSHKIVEGAGQLLIYEKPELLAAEIMRLCKLAN